MRNDTRELLNAWPRCFIRDTELASMLNKSASARHAIVKRALKAGFLVRIRKGLYLIASKTKQILPDEFELALLIYEPSMVSLESAFSYHNLIPEAVYTTTCVSPKRAQEFTTPVGMFSYKHVPDKNFYLGVRRIETTIGVILVAEPWRALADFIYTRRKLWKNLLELEADLRIDIDALTSGSKKLLKELCVYYPSPMVRRVLQGFLDELSQRKKG